MTVSLNRSVIVAAALFGFLLGAVPRGAPEVKLRYLGTAGWEISDGKTVILIDPYLSRVRRVVPNDAALAGDTRQLFTNDDFAQSDTATVDAHIQRADFIRSERAPATRGVPAAAKPPFRFRELLIEGGTLAYLIRIGGRQILALGSMDYIERELEGLRPDVAIIGAMPDRHEIHDYTGQITARFGTPTPDPADSLGPVQRDVRSVPGARH